MLDEFLLGVSYWPRRKGLAWWRAFDASEVREEFAHIRGLGLGLVRFGLLWHEFQPEADRLNHRMLDRLGVVLDAAEEANLRALPVLFTGYAAGALWYPAWALEEGTPDHHVPRLLVHGREVKGYRVKDFYEDQGMLEAQRRFLREVVGYYADHPAVWGWELGGEPERARLARATGAAEEWWGTLANLAHELAPEARLVLSLDQGSLASQTALRLDHLAELGGFVALHAHPDRSPVAEDPLDADFVLYVLTLARALWGKVPLLGSLGIGTVPTPGDPGTFLTSRTADVRVYLASETEQAEYVEKVLDGSWQMGAPGVWLMAYADAPEAQWEEPPFDEAIGERAAGVVRRDGTEKPAAEVVRRFAQRLQRDEKRPPAPGRKLEVDPDEYYRDPASLFARLYQVYQEGGH